MVERESEKEREREERERGEIVRQIAEKRAGSIRQHKIPLLTLCQKILL
jgi:hypothetical protein